MFTTFALDWLCKLKFEDERLKTFTGGITMSLRGPATRLAREGFFVAGGKLVWCAWCLTSFDLEVVPTNIWDHSTNCQSQGLKRSTNRPSNSRRSQPTSFPEDSGYSGQETDGAHPIDTEWLITEADSEDILQQINQHQRNSASEVLRSNVVKHVLGLGIVKVVVLQTIISCFYDNTEDKLFTTDDFLQEAIWMYQGEQTRRKQLFQQNNPMSQNQDQHPPSNLTSIDGVEGIQGKAYPDSTKSLSHGAGSQKNPGLKRRRKNKRGKRGRSALNAPLDEDAVDHATPRNIPTSQRQESQKKDPDKEDPTKKDQGMRKRTDKSTSEEKLVEDMRVKRSNSAILIHADSSRPIFLAYTQDYSWMNYAIAMVVVIFLSVCCLLLIQWVIIRGMN